MGLIREAAAERDIGEREVAGHHKAFRPFQAPAHHIGMRRQGVCWLDSALTGGVGTLQWTSLRTLKREQARTIGKRMVVLLF
jgi:hypothetical protein